MRRSAALPLVFLALAACGATPLPLEKNKPPSRKDAASDPLSWPFSDTFLPAPPFQGKAREADRSGLPRELSRATELLLGQGLADPRGLPYHEVEITFTTQPEGP